MKKKNRWQKHLQQILYFISLFICFNYQTIYNSISIFLVTSSTYSQETLQFFSLHEMLLKYALIIIFLSCRLVSVPNPKFKFCFHLRNKEYIEQLMMGPLVAIGVVQFPQYHPAKKSSAMFV